MRPVIPRVPLTPSRFLFGRDFFISYSRRDAAAYAGALAGRLSKRFSCYLDQLASPRGTKLPAPIRREVERATVLVLVGSPGAIESEYIRDELALFLETGRPALLVDIDGALARAPWRSPPWSSLVGVYRKHEPLEAFQRAEPSVPLLDYIQNSFAFTKQDRRLRVASTAAAVLLATVPVSAAISMFASRRARDAARRAAEARAEEAAARASAEEQRRIAASRRLAGESGAQIAQRPDLGLLLAAAAHETHPTAEARRSLFVALEFHAGLTRMLRDTGSDRIEAMTVSADRRVFATGGHERITLWDAATVEPRARIHEEGENFRGFALSPDASLLAACRSRHVSLVDTRTGAMLGRIDTGTGAVCFVGRERLAIGDGDAVAIWDVSAPERPVLDARIDLDKGVETVAGDPAGRYFVASTFDRIVVCTPAPWKNEGTVTDEDDMGLTSVAVASHADGELCAAANMGGRLAIWNLSGRQRLANMSLVGGLGDGAMFQPGTTRGGDMFAIAFSGDGAGLATGSLRGRFAMGGTGEFVRAGQLQQARSGQRDAEMALFGMTGEMGLRQRVYQPGVIGLAYVDDPPRIVVQQLDGAISVWNAAGGGLLAHTFSWPEGDFDAGHASHVFSSDGVYSLCSIGGGLSVWRVGAAEAPTPLLPDRGVYRTPVSAIAPDGERIAAVDAPSTEAPWRTVTVWERTGRVLSRMTVDDEAVVGMTTGTEANCMTIGGPADGRLVAASFENGAVVAWDIADPERPRLLGGDIFVTRVTEIAINPRRRQLAFGGHRGPVVVWDFESGARHMLSPDLPGVVTLAYSRDGGALTGFVQSSFSDDERSSRVIVWDLESLQIRSEWVMARDNTFTVSLTGGILSKSTITISPDGTAFALADDETVALWDFESHALLGALRLAERPDILMFVAEGEALLAKHYRGVTRLDVGSSRLVAKAREVAGRPLTEEEADRFQVAVGGRPWTMMPGA